MPIQTSMGANKLEIRKGSRQDVLDLVVPLDPLANAADVAAGRVFSLTAGGLLTPGLTLGSNQYTSRLPFFGLTGLDVNNLPDLTRTRGMPLGGTSYMQSGVVPTSGGQVQVLGTLVGGSGYTGAGTYYNVPLTASNSTGAASAKATVVVAGGAVTSVTITDGGSGYVGSTGGSVTLTSANTNLGGAGSGFTIQLLIATAIAAIVPVGNGASMAAIAPYSAVELASTGFDTALTYAPGDGLTATSATATAGKRGLITKATAATQPIIGWVSSAGVYTGVDGHLTLAFYPTWVLPGSAALITGY